MSLDFISRIKKDLKINGSFSQKITTAADVKQIILDGYIGCGRDSQVFNIYYISNPLLCKKKLVAKYIIFDSKNSFFNKLQREILKINHLNIEKLYQFFYSESFTLLVCEKLDFMLSELKIYKKIIFDDILNISKDITNALECLHLKLKILHGDIKDDNIMFSINDNCFKLIDFNCCISTTDFGKFNLNINIYRRPPRLISDSNDWGFFIDIWALGVVLYETYYDRIFLKEYSMYKTLNKYTLDPLPTSIYKNNLISFYKQRLSKMKENNFFFFTYFSSDDINILKEKHFEILNKNK